MENKNYQMTNEEYIQINRMLTGIAQKKYHTYRYYSGLDLEDVVSNLWIETMELINAMQRVDMPLIAKIAYRKIVDMIREEHRRLHVSIDQSMLDYTNTDKDNEISSLHSSDVSAIDIAIVEEAKNIFPEGSKEWIYINWIIDLEALPKEDLNEYPGMDRENKTKNSYPLDSFLAKKCGYPYTGSSGYRMMKNRVKAKLIELGYIGQAIE